MTIRKFGHSCLLVETDEMRILIDPGIHSKGYAELADLDAILITHVHPDHCDVAGIKSLVGMNSNVPIYTNPQVQDALKAEELLSQVLADGESISVKGIEIQAFGVDHAVVHSSIPIDKNVGFLIAGRLFHPGDAYTVPNIPVEILALPVGGPWLKIGEAVDYALTIKPKVVLPIHDAMYANPQWGAKYAERLLPQHGMAIRVFDDQNPLEIS
jgi:L-ascorbate metabolism protein UlaG (beta-lactamase superfamily)